MWIRRPGAEHHRGEPPQRPVVARLLSGVVTAAPLPPRASFVLVRTRGLGAIAIRLAQRLAGVPSRYNHAAFVVNDSGGILEAEPAGARLANLAEYTGPGFEWISSDLPVQLHLAQAGEPAGGDAEARLRNLLIYVIAARYAGKGYAWLDYAALLLLHLERLVTGRPRSTWRVTALARRRVARSDRFICSAEVDGIFTDGGCPLFTDGRLPGDVMPADLDRWIHVDGPAALAAATAAVPA